MVHSVFDLACCVNLFFDYAGWKIFHFQSLSHAGKETGIWIPSLVEEHMNKHVSVF